MALLAAAVNGYEGTGRSLSLKLIQQLRQQGARLQSGEGKAAGGDEAGAGGMRTFREVILAEPIRWVLGKRWVMAAGRRRAAAALLLTRCRVTSLKAACHVADPILLLLPPRGTAGTPWATRWSAGSTTCCAWTRRSTRRRPPRACRTQVRWAARRGAGQAAVGTSSYCVCSASSCRAFVYNPILHFPPPCLPADECDLYYVERDTLFSYHKVAAAVLLLYCCTAIAALPSLHPPPARPSHPPVPPPTTHPAFVPPCLPARLPAQASETFLQRLMSLYVASHYKNSPNDLILMSDAPAHHLFALLGPVDETQNALPDVLAVVQVALEGEISKRSAQASLAAGQLPQVRRRRRRWGAPCCCACWGCLLGRQWLFPGPPAGPLPVSSRFCMQPPARAPSDTHPSSPPPALSVCLAALAGRPDPLDCGAAVPGPRVPLPVGGAHRAHRSPPRRPPRRVRQGHT